jgi:hypothetical protein
MNNMDDWLNILSDETKSLFELLNAEEIPRARLATEFQDYSDASKNELISHIAQSLSFTPNGRLLARLKFIQTPDNTADLNLAYLVNLRSADPQARKVSLIGLNELSHPAIEDFALNALRDDADSVSTAAVQILLPKAQQEPRIRRLLYDFSQVHQNEPEFYTTLRLLEAHHLDQPED